jgi:hypothetical protein
MKKIMSNWHPSNPSNQSWGCWSTLATLRWRSFHSAFACPFNSKIQHLLYSYLSRYKLQIVCCSWNQPSYYGFICPVNELGAPEDICAATRHHCRSLTLVLLKLTFIGARTDRLRFCRWCFVFSLPLRPSSSCSLVISNLSLCNGSAPCSKFKKATVQIGNVPI